ncbi:MAG TPA: DUF4388 domain-containing protein [Kofleriaceae bacterium]
MRRRSERYEMDLSVELFADSGDGRVAMGDLSRSGMFVELQQPRPIGEQVHVAMFFEGRQLATAATVIHAIAEPNARGLGRRPGNGLAFAAPTRHADALFLRAVDRMIAVRAKDVRPQRVILRGQLADIGLAAVLVMLEQERKTCRIALSGPYRAWIELANGAIVSAAAEGRFGDPRSTVLDLLDWAEGDLEVLALPTVPASHDVVRVTHVLLEHARLHDELRAVRN